MEAESFFIIDNVLYSSHSTGRVICLQDFAILTFLLLHFFRGILIALWVKVFQSTLPHFYVNHKIR
ncbi:MAG: hypothetical protein CSA11_03795 [Chloroflexi bacterium]|nr:MAG: hypothetical protein CSA11_03795 [Chloroflexota bacterium]